MGTVFLVDWRYFAELAEEDMPNKSSSFGVRIWAHVNKNKRISIKIAARSVGLISTVETGSGIRRHENLYGKLRKILNDAGKWPTK